MEDEALNVLSSASSMFVSMRRLFAMRIVEEDTHYLTKEQLEESLKELEQWHS